MDSLKWNAIKFVWICFGLILDTLFLSHTLSLELRLTAFYTVCHLVRLVLACGHLLISHRRFFPFDNHFASSTNWISTNTKRKLILNQCQTGCLIKITAKQKDLFFSISHFISSHLEWRLFIFRQKKMVNLLPSEYKKSFCKRHRLVTPLTPIIFHRAPVGTAVVVVVATTVTVAIGEHSYYIYQTFSQLTDWLRWDRFILFLSHNSCNHLNFKWMAQRTRITRNYDSVTDCVSGRTNEQAPLNIYSEETAWANESVVYNTTPNMNYILVFSVMLNGIIIINWISNGLLLVVQVMQPARAVRLQRRPSTQDQHRNE